MSLNRAFIRAYEREQARQAATPAVEPLRARSEATPRLDSAAMLADNLAVESSARPNPATFFSAYGTDRPAAVPAVDAYAPPTRVEPAPPPYRTAETWSAEAYAPPTSPRFDPAHRAEVSDSARQFTDSMPAVEAREHAVTASSMTQTPRGSAMPYAESIHVRASLREAALQVERFAWPAVCMTLLERAERPFHTLAEQLFTGATQGRKLLVVTGYRRGEGRTTLLLTLARALAGRGARVALVDADIERPGLAEQLGVSPEVGWQDVLANQFPLEEALIESLTDGVTLLPVVSQTGWPQSIDAANVRRDLDLLRGAYDFVLVDTGPLVDSQSRVQSISLRDLAPADGAIVVHDVSTSSLVNPSITERRLAERQIDWWGIVENFAQSRK